ncbi:ANT1 (YPR128C) [Zygosaccharomyces parabailii]|uniref:ZYBA0S08-03752g1_1 n=1 Tax=Zygosaccharomyces bailii (strain CLIB 213 / ATCC 58445 / CBS 680 / BCRC 21525 / NBRC 1098 / NCYC 1416 / NRRL Y-2227) TaxID=1333698 RepID=A0A8J2T9C2_ZYGB2|nr:ANT1 (YPR128C) [Zygosaccharomyces parabailii]CDF90816.1 ZYBA0S08-03752g1_1 [Zygosaccharomyces bailii CLIB 213]CDH08999.1 related to Peroxisomal adenine nucleotide transporter 1 [Zygosaccharomyces bailii ISA1307]
MATLEAAVTGAVASSLANVAVYPLDLAKTLVQTQLKENHIAKSSGNFKGDAQNDSTVENASATDRVDGAGKQVRYENSLSCIVKIFKERGFFGLYRGMSTSILANFIQSFCYFFWYTFVRRYYFNLKSLRAQKLGLSARTRFSTIEELGLGVVAAATSQLFTMPISTIATRQQTTDGGHESATLKSVIKQIYHEHKGDVTGFWKGLKVSLVLCINPSITYASYQKLRIFLFETEELIGGGKGSELTAGQNFLLGVLSKIISTLITQPLIISKASLQRSGSQFRSFQQVIRYLYLNEGLLALWKGVRPQLAKGILVQGLLFMFKGELTKLLRRTLFLYSNVFLNVRRRFVAI